MTRLLLTAGGGSHNGRRGFCRASRLTGVPRMDHSATETMSDASRDYMEAMKKMDKFGDLRIA